VWGEMCGFVGYSVWCDRSVFLLYCVWGNRCGIVGYYVWVDM